MLPDAAIGSVIAATIASLISFVGLIISKENKTSDFRQAWIDSLRKEISTILSHVNLIDSYRNLGVEKPLDIWKDNHGSFLEINSAISSIELRINPKEQNGMKLISLLRSLEDLFSTSKENRKPNDRLDIEKEIISITQVILKSEWARVKGGENFYKSAKIIALIIVIFGASSLLISSLL